MATSHSRRLLWWLAGGISASLIAVVAAYFINPLGTASWDVRARLLGYMVYRTASSAMAPTLVHGDRVLVYSKVFRLAPPGRGDVIVFLAPGQPGDAPWISRVVAVAGDQVALSQGTLFIDGQPQAMPPGANPTPGPGLGRDMEALTVPPGEVFVLGDNRDHSMDSRYFGTVPRESLVGRMVQVFRQERAAYPVAAACCLPERQQGVWWLAAGRLPPGLILPSDGSRQGFSPLGFLMLNKFLALLRDVFSAPVDAASLRPPARHEPAPQATGNGPAEVAPAPSPHLEVVVHRGETYEPEANPLAALANAIEVVGSRHPEALLGLNPPANADAIAACEESLQRRVPPAIRALYLEHNGTSELAGGLFGGWRWLPLESATALALELSAIELDDPSDGYNAAVALPLFDYDGDVLYIECGEDGDTRLYFRDHECPVRDLVADSISGFLREFAARIESGALVFSTSESRLGKFCSYSPASRSYWPPDFDARFPRQA